jgi:hypothetical protein
MVMTVLAALLGIPGDAVGILLGLLAFALLLLMARGIDRI